MPRPNCISKIHELKYELRLAHGQPEELARLLPEYERLIIEACALYHAPKVELLRAIAPDYGKWVREEKLPWLDDPGAEPGA